MNWVMGKSRRSGDPTTHDPFFTGHHEYIINDLPISGFAGAIGIEGWPDPVYRGDLERACQVHD
jgi:hypothetical protein